MKKILIKIITALLRLLPIKKNLWVFGAWGGEQYSDNTKRLFEYLNEQKVSQRLIWITRNKNVVKQLRQKGYKVVLRATLKGMLTFSRAEIVFCTEGLTDITSTFTDVVGGKSTVVQLWHGMGSKAMRWTTSPKAVARRIQLYSSWHWASTSELYTENMSNLLGVPKDRFVVTGYPRNDALVEAPYNQNMEELRRKYDGCKFIVYMPTHRNFGAEGNKHINIDELKRVDKLLNEKNIIMVYKPHIHELKNFVKYENEFSNIILAKDQSVWGDVYSYLNYFDLLISDYSSVLTDFMCTGKPVVLFPYDIEDYQSGDAGLTDFFYDLAGGPMGYTWDEVLKYTEELLENDTWKEERERCRKIYHVFNDGKNSERVYQMVNDILKNNKK